MSFGNGHAGFDGYANFVTQGPLGTSDFQATPGITTLEIFDAPEPGWLWLVGLAGIWAARGANGRYRRRQVITDDTA